jgi:glutathione S-transferase
MYELIIANKNYSSWSMRPWVLMRAQGIAFRETLLRFDRNHGEGDFKRFTPAGRVPTLVDGDLQVWDSLAIVEYLAERHPGVWPLDAKTRAWARSATAEMHSGFTALRNDCSMNVGIRLRLRQHSAALQADLARLASLWQEGLTRHGGPFLAGAQFTAVDAFFAPVAARVQTYLLPLPAAAAAYVQRVLAVPAVNEWMMAGEAETFRDAGHEDEILAQGELLEDRRAPEQRA